MQTCTRCGRIKPEASFSLHGGRRDSFCKDCYNGSRRARYATDPAFAARRVAAAIAYKRAHPDKWRDQLRREFERNPEARRARNAVNRAVAAGRIEPQPCHCGAIPTEAHHHHGYAPEHRLDVVWLCKEHHSLVHR